MNNQDTPQNMRTHLTRELILFVKKCVKFANDPEHVKAAFRSVCEATTVDTFVEAVRVFSEDPQVEVWRYADASFGVRTREEKHLAGQAKIKGDLFEMFCSAYFNVYGCTHNLFGTKVAPRDQEGWDFESTNENGSKCLIQAKYTYAGLYDGDLTTFWKQTAITEGVENKEGTLSSVLITSAHRHQLKRDEVKGTFKVIDRKHLKKRCDNPGFWRHIQHRLYAENLQNMLG